MKTRNKIILALVLSAVCHNTFAQKEDTYNENVTINVSFDPMVSDANKINLNPSVIDTTFTKMDYTFTRLNQSYQTELKFDTIKAAQVKGEPVSQLYHLHLKGGLGMAFGGKELSNGFAPLLQASYTSLRDRRWLYGADLYSRSALAGQKNYGHNSFAQNDINLWGKRIFDRYAVTGRAFYDYSRNYLYGKQLYSDENTFNKKDYRSSWHNIGFKLGYEKLQRDNSFQHRADFLLNYTNSRRASHELDLNFKLDAYKNLALFSKASNQILGLSFDYKQAFFKYNGGDDFFDGSNIYNDFSHSAFSQNRALFEIAPYFIFDYNKFHFFASLDFVPGINSHSKFQTLPTATINFELIQQTLSLYAGMKSETTFNTLHQAFLQSPFIFEGLSLEDESNTNLFAKIQLNITPRFAIGLEGGYNTMRNHLFFTNTYIQNMEDAVENQLLSTHLDAKQYYARMDINFQISNSFRADLMAKYQKVSLEDDLNAWYTPKWNIKGKFSYQYKDKLNISLLPEFKSKQLASIILFDPDADQENTIPQRADVELKPIIDINLEASYNYTDRWNFWLLAENLAMQQYQIYYNYPVFPFTIILGAGYKF